jgi:hypothetical protein
MVVADASTADRFSLEPAPFFTALYCDVDALGRKPGGDALAVSSAALARILL